MTDDRFERDVRSFLAAREPAAVSPVLRARLQALTAEPSVRSGTFAARLGAAWRTAFGLVAAAGLAVVLLAILLRVGGLAARDPAEVGGPSAVPGVAPIPFVTVPSNLFTPQAIADAERRLTAVFVATGVEARMVATLQASAEQLVTPDGWPDRFDSDGNPDRDILAVIGIVPDRSPVCCLTLAGDLIGRARETSYWRLDGQPSALHDDLAAPTAEFRDVALDRFVRGIEDVAPRLTSLEAEGFTSDDFGRLLGVAGIVGPLLLLLLVAVRGRPVGSIAGSASAAFPPTPIATGRPTVVSAAAGPPDQPSGPRWSDRSLIRGSLVAIAALVLLGIVDLLRPPSFAPLDPSADGVGIASVGLNLVPFALAGMALAGLILYARRGRWPRRIAIATLVAVIGWTGSVVVDHTFPTLPDHGRVWVAGDGGETRSENAFLQELTYRLNPEERFTFTTTIRNPGVLPLTILGLDGIRATRPNPYVASIVGLGWVAQPTDGAISSLSARPEDASAAWPVTLGPGEELAILLVGDAGPCAAPDGAGRGLPLTHIGLAYRVLGFERSAEVGLPAVLSFPAVDPCTVPIPGGTITYGTPTQ